MIPVTTLVQQCAPFVAPKTMAAIVKVESGGNPLAMDNDSTGQRLLPSSPAQASALLMRAMALGQSVDVGIAQVNTANFAAFGLTPDNAFDACTNIRVGARILEAAYRQAVATYGLGQVALFHAFEAYNSGQLIGDPVYADKILAAAGVPVWVSGTGALRYHHLVHEPLVFTLSWQKTSPAAKSWRTAKSVVVRDQQITTTGPFSLRW
ncbi:lytic transglycosylase domain-containing protein [Acidithiobacillus thiooxidans]|uniref:Peptidase M56 n=2 Tax=Acidithiobacillus TaxID=119977 RepID=A0A5P9XTQ0_ACITH|nr:MULTISPECIES: lytic transglycosylase domain-containing protein [Acidithiobacillus]MBU2761089.1 lytic transglycosylase domain-containing protein [Acidithiobacillus sulfurivorans]MBU2836955.1 lytic transglycosylase domain-containing protein [Acidithiobacillus thiooxidans]MBU2840251.1 lytic transglycosylase domain-containing protein [Acidithiobacillus thiooxidans]QFX96733.1 peptidase M56 [Acidithiobacillus thiooxidans ATCC 19377]